jgi:hypothetical protein
MKAFCFSLKKVLEIICFHVGGCSSDLIVDLGGKPAQLSKAKGTLDWFMLLIFR